MNTTETHEREGKKMVIQHAQDRKQLNQEGQAILDKLDWSHNDQWPEWNSEKAARIQAGWVNNGLSYDGINKYEYPDTSQFNFTANGPNEQPKISLGYMDCIGVVIVGLSKDAGEEISLMTHQSPQRTIDSPEFNNWLSSKVKDLQDKVDPSSIEVCIFGGKDGFSEEAYEKLTDSIANVEPKKNYQSQTDYDRHYSPEAHIRQLVEPFLSEDAINIMLQEHEKGNKNYLRPFLVKLKENYNKAVERTTKVLLDAFGETITIHIEGPTRGSEGTNAYFDTASRNLVVINPSTDEGEVYLPPSHEEERGKVASAIREVIGQKL